MENKKKIIITIAILAIAIVVVAVLLALANNSSNGEVGDVNVQTEKLANDLDKADVDTTNLDIPEYFDVEKIIEAQTIENENMAGNQASILESPAFSIPKNVSGIEMMTAEDKAILGIDQNLDIQVLGRNEVGQITGYQFIYSEEDFILDLR